LRSSIGISFQQGESGQDAEGGLRTRSAADGHGLAEPWLVGLGHEHVRHAGDDEVERHRQERRFVGHGQDDGVRATWNDPAGLARGVHQLGGKDAKGQILPHDGVVVEDRPGAIRS